MGLVAGIVLLAVFAGTIQHWIAVHTGVEVAGPDKYYNWWSGFGSDLGELTLITAILTPAIVAARHHNCATRGCWRLTSHTLTDPQSGIAHRLCHKHHPLISTDHTHHGILRNHMSDEHLADVRARAAPGG
jgi:hypothetical protein